MIFLFILLFITVGSIVLFVKKKKAWFLVLPFLSLFIYFIIEVALVPAPFLDTLKFIFSLQ
jgi:hypothetical protein